MKLYIRAVLTALMVCAIAPFSSASVLSKERRVALIIGNSEYGHNNVLDNPHRDARALAKSLRAIGFEVVLGIDLDKTRFRQTISRFTQKLEGADVGLFFYAGHAIQINAQNYLVPIRARLQDENSIETELIRLGAILKKMNDQLQDQSKVKLVFLDACRNNPLAEDVIEKSEYKTRSARRTGKPIKHKIISRGLAEVDTEIGSYIAFATKPGTEAFDGTGRHSPFTSAMLKHIKRPGLEVSAFMRHVRLDVKEQTEKLSPTSPQVPWDHSSLIAPFYFNGAQKTSKADPELVAERDTTLGQLSAEKKNRADNHVQLAMLQKHASKKRSFSFGGDLHGASRQDDRRSKRDTRRKILRLQSKIKISDRLIRTYEKKLAFLEQKLNQYRAQSGTGLNKAFSKTAFALQAELKRVGCYRSRIDGKWGPGSYGALMEFNHYGKIKPQLPPDQPSQASVNRVKRVKYAVCGQKMIKRIAEPEPRHVSPSLSIGIGGAF